MLKERGAVQTFRNGNPKSSERTGHHVYSTSRFRAWWLVRKKRNEHVLPVKRTVR